MYLNKKSPVNAKRSVQQRCTVVRWWSARLHP